MPASRNPDSPFLRRVSIPLPQSRADAPSGATVAVVTEDDELASACARVLSEEGFVVHTAVHSGHAMLACLRGRIDLVVSELATEEGSGPALTRRMRRHNPGIRAVYIAKAGTHCEADNVLVRPFGREDLLAAIRRQLARP